MPTKDEIREMIRKVTDKEISQTEFLRFAAENEDDVIKACDSRRERFVVKNAIKTYKLFYRKK